MPTFELDGKVALVTGGARGIGLHTARELRRCGAAVAIVDLDAADGAAATLGDRVLGLGGDVTDAAAMQAVVADVVARLGGIDIVVANAGIAPRLQTLQASDPAAFERVIEVNLLGVHRTVHAALPHVVARGGHVVVIASIYAFLNGALAAPYAISKAGVEQYGRALRVELAAQGASAGVAYFGLVDTAMVQTTFGDTLGARFEQILPRVLAKRIGPEAAAWALVRGIERRQARVVAPRRWAAYAAMRGLVNPPLDRWLERNTAVHAVARDADLAATAAEVPDAVAAPGTLRPT